MFGPAPAGPPLGVTRAVRWIALTGLVGLAGFVALPLVGGLRSDIAIPTRYALPAATVMGLTLTAGWRTGRRTDAVRTQIERQLCDAAVVPPGESLRLEPAAGAGPLAAGWNRIVASMRGDGRGSNLEHRLAEALAGMQSQKSERFLNGLPDGVAATDADGRITFANRALKSLVGTPDADLAGKFLDELLPLHGQRQADAVRRALRQHGQPWVVELQRSADMTDGMLRVARTPLAGDGHEPKASLWTIRDITQQKLAEEARNQFVCSATHELRTPLANIKAYAETLMLGDAIDDEHQKEFFNIINSEATRLARFVDELLDVSRMEAGSLSLDRQATDMERLLTETVEKVRPQMTQKQIAFDVSIPPKLPELRIDKDKVAAALVNLLGNAAKYTPDGGRVKLTVECDARELHVHVEDTGIGIAPEELSKLGTKFFRSSDARVRDITGSGLGLSFVQEAARLHGGRLSVTSELNRGSRFSLTLPLG